MATAPLATITYKKEAKVLQYEGALYAGLGRFYLGGAPAARADWAARRAWTTQRAGVGAAPLADALARLYRERPPPEDEREARGDRACGLAIQEARQRFGRELSHDDVRLMRNVGYTLDDLVAYLEQFDDDDDAAAARPALRVYSDAELEAPGYVAAPGGPPDDDDDDEEDGVPAPGFDLPVVYRHLVSPLDRLDADDADPFVDAGRAVTAAAIARALRGPGRLPLPAADAAAWQKEAVAVCRLLLAQVARRLDTVRRQLAILEKPPPSRARFRPPGSRGSPYEPSPLASGCRRP